MILHHGVSFRQRRKMLQIIAWFRNAKFTSPHSNFEKSPINFFLFYSSSYSWTTVCFYSVLFCPTQISCAILIILFLAYLVVVKLFGNLSYILIYDIMQPSYFISKNKCFWDNSIDCSFLIYCKELSRCW